MRKIIALNDKQTAINKLVMNEQPRNNLMKLLDAISKLKDQGKELSNDNLSKESGLSKGQIATVKKKIQDSKIDVERLLGLPKKEKKQNDHFLVQFRMQRKDNNEPKAKRKKKKTEPINIELLSNTTGLSQETISTLLLTDDNLEAIQILAKRTENNRVKKAHYIYINLYLGLFTQSIKSSNNAIDKALEELKEKIEIAKVDKQINRIEIDIRRIKQLTTQVSKIRQAYRTYRTDLLTSEIIATNKLIHAMMYDIQSVDRPTYDQLVKLNKAIHAEYN